ncbi:hypothetical protein QU814_04570 [Providencia rettgeri]|nr:hypothetical protein [Providencia rettgeri]MDM9282469.1 hypothetical protein [Providencia rettgeri]
MKKHSGATTIIKSLINYGLVYQGKDGLYHVSDDCEKMLRDGKFRSHDTSASSNGIVAETALSALVQQFDALLAGVRAWAYYLYCHFHQVLMHVGVMWMAER